MNKGFTLVEILVVMFTITIFSSLFFVVFRVPQYEYINPVTCQLEAFAKRKRCYFKDSIWFNQNGNINRAATHKIGNTTCVFQLGFGRFRCE